MEQEHPVHHSGRLKFGGNTWVIGMSEIRVSYFCLFVVLNHCLYAKGNAAFFFFFPGNSVFPDVSSLIVNLFSSRHSQVRLLGLSF